MRQRTTIRLPQDLLGRAKQKAAAERRSLNALIEDGLRRVVYGSPKTIGKRILPRISTATGGLMPRVDISNSSALQEMDDLEYIERMKHFS